MYRIKTCVRVNNIYILYAHTVTPHVRHAQVKRCHQILLLVLHSLNCAPKSIQFYAHTLFRANKIREFGMNCDGKSF